MTVVNLHVFRFVNSPNLQEAAAIHTIGGPSSMLPRVTKFMDKLDWFGCGERDSLRCQVSGVADIDVAVCSRSVPHNFVSPSFSAFQGKGAGTFTARSKSRVRPASCMHPRTPTTARSRRRGRSAAAVDRTAETAQHRSEQFGDRRTEELGSSA